MKCIRGASQAGRAAQVWGEAQLCGVAAERLVQTTETDGVRTQAVSRAVLAQSVRGAVEYRGGGEDESGDRDSVRTWCYAVAI